MTEMVNGDGQDLGSAGVPVTPSSTPQALSEERTFRQSEVNDIAARRAAEAVERFKRETSMASHNGHSQQGNGYNPPPTPTQQSGMSREEYRQMAAEAAQQSMNDMIRQQQEQSDQQRAHGIAQQFLAKVEAGKGKYQDFDKKFNEVGFSNFPHIVQLVNEVENTEDVVYDLMNNPVKIGNIQSLVDHAVQRGLPPTLALMEIRKLSQSIKDNANAKNFKSPNEPLSQLRPASAGTDNKGAWTASDYRKNPKYKV